MVMLVEAKGVRDRFPQKRKRAKGPAPGQRDVRGNRDSK